MINCIFLHNIVYNISKIPVRYKASIKDVLYPPFLIDKQIKLFFNNKLSKNDTHKEISNKENTIYHKLPYIGDISVTIKKKIGESSKRFCKNTDINIVLTPFKISCLYSSNDKLPNALRSFVVYKFKCAGCQSCYNGETRHYLATRIKEHLVTDKKSYLMKHLMENKTCKNLCDESCFQVTDYASSSFRLKVKEALDINWLNPDLNKQKEHVSITTSV